MSNPFYLMFPQWAILPAVFLATAATIIASQAVITGAFSLVRQAIHLGYLPRMEILFTSETNTGQIYLPAVNTILLFGVVALVLTFKSSDALATAYGISVTGAMVVTSMMFFEFVRKRWQWSIWLAIGVLAPLLLLELIFLGANLLKIHDGGYVPVLLAIAFTIIMTTWQRGSKILFAKTRRSDVPLKAFVASVEKESAHAPVRVPGTAIFLTGDPDAAPAALLHNLKHNHVLHDKNVILTIRTEDQPRVRPENRYTLTEAERSFCRSRTAFRLHGNAERHPGARLPQAHGLQVRHHVHLVLSRSPQAGAGSEIGHARLAEPTVHRACRNGRRSLGLLPPSGQPRGGTRVSRRRLIIRRWLHINVKPRPRAALTKHQG